MDPAAPDQMPGLMNVNQPADPNLQQFQQLEGQAADVEQAAATNTAQTAQQLSTMQPPQRQTGVLSQAPYLMALAALGGKAIGLHARVMLGGLNGMVKGMLMGNQQAYDDAIKTYTENRQKMLDTYDLQDRYYGELVQAYGTRADAKLKAWEAAEKLANNEFDKRLAIQAAGQRAEDSAFYRMDANRRFIEEVKRDDLKKTHEQFQDDMARQKMEMSRAALDLKLSQAQGPNGIKQLDDWARTLTAEASALRQSSITGYEGMTEPNKQRYNEILQQLAAINVRKQELLQQANSQPSAPAGSPGEPRRPVGAGVDPATGQPASPQASSGAPPHPGWTIQWDKNGNQAWVSPDKTQWQPVQGSIGNPGG